MRHRPYQLCVLTWSSELDSYQMDSPTLISRYKKISWRNSCPLYTFASYVELCRASLISSASIIKYPVTKAQTPFWGHCRKGSGLLEGSYADHIHIYIAGQRLEWIVTFTKSLEIEDLVLAFQNSLQGRVFCSSYWNYCQLSPLPVVTEGTQKASHLRTP